jgi:chemotaxis protein methyltransferase CheR
MKNHDCVTFLQWALPRFQLRWRGIRKVRGQACKRIQRRYQELGLPDVTAYREYLSSHPAEWAVVDACCRITISRFYRDRTVFHYLQQTLLPGLAQWALERHDPSLRCWSAGCASGEEPYTLKMLWELTLSAQFPNLPLQMVATDADAHLLERAQAGCYPFGSLKELPADWLPLGFERRNQEYCVRPPLRTGIEFIQQDIRCQQPAGHFHLILCRNLVFTYFAVDQRQDMVNRLAQKLWPGGVLIVGKHETLPSDTLQFEPLQTNLGAYRLGDELA